MPARTERLSRGPFERGTAQGVWFGGPGIGAGPAYGYGPYYADWGSIWSSDYAYGPGVDHAAYGYPASYGYTSGWYGSDVALETYAAPLVRHRRSVAASNLAAACPPSGAAPTLLAKGETINAPECPVVHWLV
jgi:hypothetical protein